MDLRKLAHFVAVAEHLHFGRAALALHTAQPALSQSIRLLETELGFPLFERSRRHVALTPAGASLLPEARRTLAQAERTVHVAERLRRGTHGQLRIGFVGSATFGALPSAVSRFRSVAPEVSLALVEMSTHAQIDALHDDELDVGFIRPPVASSDLQLTAVRREPLIAALPADHRLCGVAELSLAHLRNEPFLLFPRRVGPGYVDLVLSACLEAGFSPRVDHEVDDMQTIVSLVSAGLGVGLVPEPVRHLQLPGVAYRALVKPVWSELAMAWTTRPGAPTLDRFVRVVTESIEPADASSNDTPSACSDALASAERVQTPR